MRSEAFCALCACASAMPQLTNSAPASARVTRDWRIERDIGFSRMLHSFLKKSYRVGHSAASLASVRLGRGAQGLGRREAETLNENFGLHAGLVCFAQVLASNLEFRAAG